MRYTRQNKILELIEESEIETQDQLVSLLKETGIDVTQATVSRDIKELQLIKSLSPSGKYKYAVAVSIGAPATERFKKIFRETVKAIASSGNLIVIKALTGCGNAACEALDTIDMPHIIGTIAGDNTILVVADDSVNVPKLVEDLNRLLV